MKPHDRARWDGITDNDLLDLEEDFCLAIGELIDELHHIQKDPNTAARRLLELEVRGEIYRSEEFLREARQEIIIRGLW